MRLSSLGDYAVVLMSAAARGPARLTATALAEDTGIPLPTTQKLLGRLAAAGLFRSGRGASGGFTLARDPSSISLADIVEAVEGPIALTTCMGEGTPCVIHDDCRVRPQMGAVNGAVRGALANVSLAHLSSPLPLAGGAGGGLSVSGVMAGIPTPSPSRKREGSKVL